MAFGSPASDADVPAFLERVTGQAPSEAAVAGLCARYRAIGGSPLLRVTRVQAERLRRELATAGVGPVTRVEIGMRHSPPFIATALERLSHARVDQIVALPLTPQSSPDRDEYFEAIQQASNASNETVPVIPCGAWHDDPSFITALASRTAACTRRFGGREVRVLFTAHSLPSAGAGTDIYVSQLQATAAAIAKTAKLPATHWQLVFQSIPPGAPGNWLGPDLLTTIPAICQPGTAVVVVPIQFVTDNLETLYDIDIVARGVAKSAGVAFARVRSLNTSRYLVEALARTVVIALS